MISNPKFRKKHQPPITLDWGLYLTSKGHLWKLCFFNFLDKNWDFLIIHKIKLDLRFVSLRSPFFFILFLYSFICLFIWKRFLCSSGLFIFKLLLYTVYTRKILGKEALFFSAIVTWKKEELLFSKKSRIKSIMFCLSPFTLIINVFSF